MRKIIEVFDFFIPEGIRLNIKNFMKNPIVTINPQWAPYGKVLNIDFEKKKIEIDFDEGNKITKKILELKDNVYFYPHCRKITETEHEILYVCYGVK